MAEVAIVEANQEPSHSPLVSVSFQKDEQRKFKFLEGEPKALGLTQICLSIFHISCVGSGFAIGLTRVGLEIPLMVSSVLIIIAGSLAIAAKNLHLPTLRACLGMEVIAGGASLFNLIGTMINMSAGRYYCYYYDSSPAKQACIDIENAHLHLFAESAVVQVTLFAISISLVVYAAKVAKCCSSSPKVTVITVQAPPAPQ